MANLLWTVCIIQLAYYMVPSSRLGEGGGHPRATVSTHWLNYMRVASGFISVGDRETDGNGNRLIWFAKNSMHHNHDETVMPGMPETPGGRS